MNSFIRAGFAFNILKLDKVKLQLYRGNVLWVGLERRKNGIL